MINELPDKLKNDIIEYCKLNNIDDVNKFIIKLIRDSFTIEKFGLLPNIPIKKVEEVKKETIEIKVEQIIPTEKSVPEIKSNKDIYGEW
jgi:hypothetical protein